MKYRVEFLLFICMIATGVIYGVAFHLLVMPIFGGLEVHCISTGVLFQGVNYFIVLIFYKKYSSLKQTNMILNKNLEIDKLTELFNRRAFDNYIMTLNEYDQFSVIFIDIDNFRDFNNKYGHHTGDIVLRDVSAVIKSIVGSKGNVYRYGGEEIVILLKDYNKAEAEKMAQTIRIGIYKLHNSSFLRITLSLGVASYPEHGFDIYDIIEASDNALLKAKARGKNCVEVYSKDIL
jgi:diguanylate cyclase (GGDEF)-like protein